MEKKITLGIDLGTTYSAVAYVDEHGDPKIIPNSDGERITPSVVYFESENNIIVGQNAKDEMELSPDKVVAFVKREMGKSKDEVRKEENYGEPKPYDFYGKRYSPEEISSLILKKLKQDAELYFHGQEITDVVITVPAYFNDSEKKATKDAGEMAGFNVLQVINEPTAAAIAYGVSKQASESQKVFVFDLGGGTFDVTVLDVKVNNTGEKEINIINTDGDHRLGGKDWDDKIIEYIAQEFINQYGEDPRDDKDAMADLRMKSERTKITLSKRDKARIAVKTEENSLKLEITREKFEEITTDLMSRVEGLCDLVLTDANLTWNDIDTILLVGGSTRMPMVVNMLKKISGKEIRTDLIQPDECVALGAALHSKIILINQQSQAQNLSHATVSQEIKDKLGSIKVNDIVSHTLGIVTVREENGQYINVVTPIIEKGAKIPCEITKTFGTLDDNQPSVLLQIKEGESSNPENVPTIQEATLDIVSKLPANSPIEVTYKIATDGMLTVIGRDVTNNKEIMVKIERENNMSKEEIEAGKNHIRNIDIS